MLRIIQREPGIMRGKLQSNSHFLAKRLDEILNTLKLEEKIVEKSTGKGKSYYPINKQKISKKTVADLVKARG